MTELLVAILLLLLVSCVSGLDMIGPEDPNYTVICVDSTLTDTTVACWPTATITIVIDNPLIG